MNFIRVACMSLVKVCWLERNILLVAEPLKKLSFCVMCVMCVRVRVRECMCKGNRRQGSRVIWSPESFLSIAKDGAWVIPKNPSAGAVGTGSH